MDTPRHRRQASIRTCPHRAAKSDKRSYLDRFSSWLCRLRVTLCDIIQGFPTALGTAVQGRREAHVRRTGKGGGSCP